MLTMAAVDMNGSSSDRLEAISRSSTPLITAAVITGVYCVVCVLGLFGNVLVMFVIVRFSKMKTATNIYIFNLALADALASSTLPFQCVYYMLRSWPFGDAVCKLVMCIDYYNIFTSIFTLTTLSVDRYVAVCHPIKALDFHTPCNAKIVNICNWILSSVIGIPVIIIAAATKDDVSGVVDCTLLFPHPSWYWDNLLKICVFVFSFILPVSIITLCYGLLLMRLKSVRMLSGSKEKDNNMRHITRTVLVVVTVFIICWAPIHVFVIVEAFADIPGSLLHTVLWHFCIALGYTNSCLNPVLYAFLDENFKRCFQESCIPFWAIRECRRSHRERNPHRPHNSITSTTRQKNQQAQTVQDKSIAALVPSEDTNTSFGL